MEKETLRPQWDSRKQLWRIAKKTYRGSGGWCSFGSGSVYTSRAAAEWQIEQLVKNYPALYQTEKTEQSC